MSAPVRSLTRRSLTTNAQFLERHRHILRARSRSVTWGGVAYNKTYLDSLVKSQVSPGTRSKERISASQIAIRRNRIDDVAKLVVLRKAYSGEEHGGALASTAAVEGAGKQARVPEEEHGTVNLRPSNSVLEPETR